MLIFYMNVISIHFLYFGQECLVRKWFILSVTSLFTNERSHGIELASDIASQTHPEAREPRPSRQ